MNLHLRACRLQEQATHSLADPPVARPQGRSKWNDLHFSHSRPSVLCWQSHFISPYLSKLHLEACPLHLHRPPIARSEILMYLLVKLSSFKLASSDWFVGAAAMMELESTLPSRCLMGKTTLMSVAVTQSCSTGLFSNSSALGRSARVENAILEPAAS